MLIDVDRHFERLVERNWVSLDYIFFLFDLAVFSSNRAFLFSKTTEKKENSKKDIHVP